MEDDNDVPFDTSSLQFSQHNIITRCKFKDDDLVPPSSGLDKSLFEDHLSYQTTTNGNCSPSSAHNQRTPTFRTILDVIHGSLIGPTNYSEFMQNISNNKNTNDNMNNTHPTISGIATHFANQDGKTLDEKQYITYEIICCTLLQQLLNETHNPISPLYKQMDIAVTTNANNTLVPNIRDQSIAQGGMDQLSFSLPVLLEQERQLI